MAAVKFAEQPGDGLHDPRIRIADKETFSALEPAHAIAWVMRPRRGGASDELILINLSGRGDKDVAMVAELTGATV